MKKVLAVGMRVQHAHNKGYKLYQGVVVQIHEDCKVFKRHKKGVKLYEVKWDGNPAEFPMRWWADNKPEAKGYMANELELI